MEPTAGHTSLPEVESVESGRLTDEISDVIEECGVGLDAEALSESIERVATDFELHAPRTLSASELTQELRRFVDRYAGELEREDLVALLRDISADLKEGELSPEIELLERGSPHRLALRFHSAFALQVQIPKLLDSRGYFVESDLPFTHLDDVRIRVENDRAETTATLIGSVVRTAPNGFAVRVAPASREHDRRLRDLPAEIRATRLSDEA